MKRRSLLAASLCNLAGLPLMAAYASNSCSPIACVAQVPFYQFAARYEPQFQSEWCWAACISMIFDYYGHPVTQERVVTEAYGAPANVPAGSGFVIAQALNRSWVDDNGHPFRSVLRAAFDAQAGLAAINSAIIVQALARGYPLIVGARTHATVMTAVSYVSTRMGTNILQVGVFDPRPGRGGRKLLPDEMIPAPVGSLMFIALPIVS